MYLFINLYTYVFFFFVKKTLIFKNNPCYPSSSPSSAVHVPAGAPAEPGKDNDEGSDVEDGGQAGVKHFHPQEGER